MAPGFGVPVKVPDMLAQFVVSEHVRHQFESIPEAPKSDAVTRRTRLDRPAWTGGWLALLILAAVSCSVRAAGDLEKLLSEDDAGPVQLQSASLQGTKRSRIARFNSRLLQGESPAVFEPLSRFVVNLFPDQQPRVQVQSVETPGAGRRVSHGRIEGLPESHWLLAEEAGTFSAAVFIPGHGSYTITSSGAGDYRINELDATQLGKCGVEADAVETIHNSPFRLSSVTGKTALLPGVGAQLDPTGSAVTILDVMVVYTPAALAGAGSEAAMNTLIDLAVAEANTTYQNSRANARLRLVHRALVNYQESDLISTNLTRLQTPGDGFLDEVQGLRETNRADVVCLITEKGEGSQAGLAFTPSDQSPAFRNQAYSVVKRSAAIGSYIFVHEISHNLGCQHDRENAIDGQGKPNTPVFPYAYGYRFTAQGVLRRDVMAYAPGEPVPFFSNPNISFGGAPMGVAEGTTNAADNTRVINNMAALVAGFYGPAVVSTPPTLKVLTPLEGTSVSSQDTLTLSALALDLDGSVRRVEFYTNSFLAGVVSNGLLGVYSLALPALPPGAYELVARAVDNLGADVALRALHFDVRPVNDAFAAPVILTGANFTVNGSNLAATFEADEPKHAHETGGRSVWYSWVAPKSGTVELTGLGTTVYPLVDAYKGASLLTIASVARSIRFNPGGFQTTVTFDTLAGQAYYFAVDSQGGAGDAFTLQLAYQPAPANDDYGRATIITGAELLITGSNSAATLEPGETKHASNTGSHSIWFAWTAPKTGDVQLTGSATNFFPLVDVYTGATLAAATNVPGLQYRLDTTNRVISVIFPAVAGTTYSIVVDGALGGSGNFTLQLAYPAGPPNDLLANRQIISGPLVHFIGTNANSTAEAGEPAHADNAGGHSVWYGWIAPVSGPVTLSVSGNRFFPLADVYTGDTIGALARVPRTVTFRSTNLTCVVNFNAEAGRAYALAVDGFSGLSGLFIFDLGTLNLPAILKTTNPPASTPGDFAFSFTGEGNRSFVVQASTDLATWADVFKGAFVSNSFLYSEALGTGQSRRFYRVRPAP